MRTMRWMLSIIISQKKVRLGAVILPESLGSKMLIRSRSFISTETHLISGFLGVVLMDEYLKRGHIYDEIF